MWSYSEQKRNIIGLSNHDNDSDFLEVQGLGKGTWKKMIFDFLPPNLFYASVHFVLILLQGYRPPEFRGSDSQAVQICWAVLVVLGFVLSQIDCVVISVGWETQPNHTKGKSYKFMEIMWRSRKKG